MRRTPKQERAKLMVGNIIEAGFLAIAKSGPEGTTTRHIADIAGISPGTLYQYFPDKEAVYEEMQRRFVSDIVALLRTITAELVQKDVREGVFLLLSQFSDLLKRDDGRYLHFASHFGQFHLSEHTAKVERELMRLAAQYAIHNPAVMTLRNFPTIAYIIINGGVFTVIRYLSAPSPQITLEQLVAGLANMVEGYMRVEQQQLVPSTGPINRQQ